MAISPVSDIVLEVAKAADPTRYRAAAARLSQADGGFALQQETFEDALGAVRSNGAAAPRLPFDPALTLVQMRNNAAQKAQPAGPYEQFEAFVLQTFIESMLPQNGKALFGAGTAGQIWKSMLAQGLGAQLARAGGIGIARTLAAHEPGNDGTQRTAEMPNAPTRS